MKKLTFLLLFASTVLYAQETTGNHAFTSTTIGLFWGINFENFSKINGAFQIEGASNLGENFFAKLSLGYYKSVSYDSYTVNTYKYVSIDDYQKYHAVTYDVVNTEYQVIPFSIGLQNYFYLNHFTPYLLLDFSYNLIDPVTEKSSEVIIETYDSIDEIPAKYKNTVVLPQNFVSFSVGAGVQYNIFSKLALNLRYVYIINNEIINTHQLLIGISI